MTDKRTLTVSATINLGNYENLRIEVSDLAESAEEADALRHFLASVLDGYGNNSALARAAIQKYKEHILEDGAEFVPADAGMESYADSYSVPAGAGMSLFSDADAGTAADAEPESAENDAEYGAFSGSASIGEMPVQKPDITTTPIPGFKPVSIPVPMPEPVSAPGSAPKSGPESYNLPPAPLVEEKNSEEYICSKCGARVNKLQRDVSMLFNHKILCKDCMK